MPLSKAWRGVIREYSEYLPLKADSPVISMLEGGTPLIEAQFISRELGAKIFLKLEGMNPTGSFKDRGMTVAVSKAVEEGARVVMCASTGNTSASAAAYAAKAGLKCVVLIPEGAIAIGKLAQALIHGAQVISIKGNFDEALSIAKRITEEYPVVLVNSLNPNRIEGQKTAAFELCDELGRAPDAQIIPVGNAGNITAYWRGYIDYQKSGVIEKLPKMLGFQAEGAAPIVRGEIIKEPKTIATAIRIGNPASWKGAVRAAEESGGKIDMVSDEEILTAYKLLASREGIFVEPASAASIAGLYKVFREGSLAGGSTVVCIMTGHGLKDPDRAVSSVQTPKSVRAHKGDILREMGF